MIGQSEAVEADLVGSLGQSNDLGEVLEGRADGEAHPPILPYFPVR